MVDYPYSTSFITAAPLAAWPVKLACTFIPLGNTITSDEDIATAMAAITEVTLPRERRERIPLRCTTTETVPLHTLHVWRVLVEMQGQRLWGLPLDGRGRNALRLSWLCVAEEQTMTSSGMNVLPIQSLRWLKTALIPASSEGPYPYRGMRQDDISALDTIRRWQMWMEWRESMDSPSIQSPMLFWRQSFDKAPREKKVGLRNGYLDPWSGGGVSKGDKTRQIFTPLVQLVNPSSHRENPSLRNSAHHLDLRQPNTCDPSNIMDIRRQAHKAL